VRGTIHYWEENPKEYLDCIQQFSPDIAADISTVPSIMATIQVGFETSIWVVLLGALIGSLIGYTFPIIEHIDKRPWSGLIGASILGLIVALLLERVGDAGFFVTINVGDFWGAIMIGFIAQYTGSQIIEHIVRRREQPSPEPPRSHSI
jgi:hypothetical protein